MRIDVGRIKGQRGASIRSQFADIFPSPFGDEGKWNGPVDIDVKVSNAGHCYLVTGTLTGEATLTCHRCLKQYVDTITVDIEETYVPEDRHHVDDNDMEQIDEEAWDDEDGNTFTGDSFDIRDVVSEYATLASPVKSTCREDCKGLCPRCGADLNDVECGCHEHLTDPRLASLEQLLKGRD